MTQPEASYYEKLDGSAARCLLCPQQCVIKPGRTGICSTRENIGGTLTLNNYGKYTSLSADPIEKKPLYHFFPGREILSIGGRGCNLTCDFCQNHGISQGAPPTRDITPEALAAAAAQLAPTNVGLAFTYNEPFIWFEFIRDCAPLLRERGMKVVLVTNGFVNSEPLAELLPLIDAMNIDLKSFSDSFYKEYCGARIEPVKDTVKSSHAAGVHIEITLLLITSLNDSPEEVGAHADWIASVSDKIPLHISRYFPTYKMTLPPTPTATMTASLERAKSSLLHVYAGNMGGGFSDTMCGGCGKTIVGRHGYDIDISGLAGGCCAACGADANIIN